MDFEQLLAQLAFDAAELRFRRAALFAAFVLDREDLVERLDQRFIGMLERFDIDNAAFGFLRRRDGFLFQGFRVLLQ